MHCLIFECILFWCWSKQYTRADNVFCSFSVARSKREILSQCPQNRNNTICHFLDGTMFSRWWGRFLWKSSAGGHVVQWAVSFTPQEWVEPCLCRTCGFCKYSNWESQLYSRGGQVWGAKDQMWSSGRFCLATHFFMYVLVLKLPAVGQDSESFILHFVLKPLIFFVLRSWKP